MVLDQVLEVVVSLQIMTTRQSKCCRWQTMERAKKDKEKERHLLTQNARNNAHPEWHRLGSNSVFG